MKVYLDSLIGCIVMFLITLTAEFAAMFMSISVYFNRILAIQVALKAFGCIITALFLEREWSALALWAIWAVFSLLPVFMDGICFFAIFIQGRQTKT